ncbi:hypothetical protein T07_9745 [Trichinella nelsoni]|uniref:Uncharacterized protein n=1 Tax=Trichinella nelsoni TaxID=6336 RepID=A0A0V0RF75_9BILA|nr:hypothetical protein T07_9745 [Trichinella nelsoni]
MPESENDFMASSSQTDAILLRRVAFAGVLAQVRIRLNSVYCLKQSETVNQCFLIIEFRTQCGVTDLCWCHYCAPLGEHP